MEQLQGPPQPHSQVLPQIVQVIHLNHASSNIIYQPSSHTLNNPSNHVALPHDIHTMHHQVQPQITIQPSQDPVTHQNQQNLPLQTQVLQQNQDISRLTQHTVLPQILLNSSSFPYYGQYQGMFQKEASSICPAKLEPEVSLVVQNKQIRFEENKQDKSELSTVSGSRKKNRNPVPNPSMWACNVRKLKHQRGEAYISRRGKYIPERKVRNTKDCLKSCKYKCSASITDTDREHLFKAFYSLSSNEKKHFLLNTTERSLIRPKKSDVRLKKRQYSFKYFFLVRAVRYTVCKNFYLGTLAISQKPVYNVHSGKSEMNIPKPDGRGLSEASTHTIPSEIKDRVRKHIMSFKTLDLKPIVQFSPKKQYLSSFLSIKQMYKMYLEECKKNNVECVKESMYRKIMKHEFNLHFKKVKVEQQLCTKCKGPVKKEKK